MPTRPESHRNHLVYDMEIRGEGPKGGSPKTPLPIHLRKAIAETDESVPIVLETPDGNGLWKTIATSIGGILIALGIIYAIGEHMAEFNALSRTVAAQGQEIKDMNDKGTSYTRFQMQQDLKFHDDVELRLRKLEGRPMP